MSSTPSDDDGQQADPIDRLPVDFAAFFLREHPGWLRYAHQRLQHRPDAEDAIQDAGVALFKVWDRALSSSDLDAFSFKVVKDAVADTLRARARAEAKKVRLAAQPEAADTSQAEMERLAYLDAFNRALAVYARDYPVQAEVVRLRQTGMSYQEIGAATGLAHTTARTYYSLGRRALQYMLDTDRHDD
ncbi:RNA polymerase sigma factor [Kitasatospora sp. NPDC059088]|uniref:RNA polymerase sigma factor n=1 Tax=Kitasatospora sp. NPDC059088 TaxID=3346722 RepID=UPI00368A6346